MVIFRWVKLSATDCIRCSRLQRNRKESFAKIFVESGEFYWNTGLFLSNVKYLRECFCKILPPVLRDYDKQYPEFSVETENAYMKETFSSYPNISVDFGVLDKPTMSI